MNDALVIALMNLIARVGIEKAIDIFGGLKKAATIDDAIAALQETQKKTWEDYKREA
jgi:hypothetical protein